MTRPLPPQALYFATEVPNAPFQPGARVLVLLDLSDESADERFHGSAGEVVSLLFDDPVNQYPARPMVEVNVEGLGRDFFFADELQLLQ